MKHRRKIKDNPRNRLGLSQQDLANYLGVSRSQVAMWECEKRFLPDNALDKLVLLEMGLANSKASKKTGRSVTLLQKKDEEQQSKTAGKMMNWVSMHRPNAEKLERRLKDSIEKKEPQLTLLSFIDEQLDSLPENKTNEGDLLWLKVQQNTVGQRLLKLNKEIARLSFDIDLLRAVAEVYERHWGKE